MLSRNVLTAKLKRTWVRAHSRQTLWSHGNNDANALTRVVSYRSLTLRNSADSRGKSGKVYRFPASAQSHAIASISMADRSSASFTGRRFEGENDQLAHGNATSNARGIRFTFDAVIINPEITSGSLGRRKISNGLDQKSKASSAKEIPGTRTERLAASYAFAAARCRQVNQVNDNCASVSSGHLTQKTDRLAYMHTLRDVCISPLYE